MIKPSDKKIIISALGKHYTAAVLRYLEKKKIQNPNTGHAYSPSSIRKIVCGHDENELVETAVIDLAVKTRIAKAKADKRRKEKLRK